MMFKHIKNVNVAGGSTQLNVDEVFTSTYEIYKVVWRTMYRKFV